MTLLPDWTTVLRKAWSVRLMVVAAVLTGFEAILPIVEVLLPVPRGAFAAASFLVVLCAFVARLMAQKNMEGKHE